MELITSIKDERDKINEQKAILEQEPAETGRIEG